MRELNHQAARWLREHHSTIGAGGLAAAGVSHDQRRRMVTAGTIESVVTGVYRFAGAPPDDWSNAAALCSRSDELAVGGLSAAWWWGIRTGRAPDGVTRFVTGRAARPTRAPWARFYRTDSFDRADTVVRSNGLRLTNPSRTTVDLARDLGESDLALAIESVLSMRLASLHTLAGTAERAAEAGARTAQRFLRVLAGRAPGAPRESSWEQRVLDALARRGVAGLVSQVPDRFDGYGAARFDLAIAALRWVVEVDVHPHHRELAGQAGDHRRDRCSRWAGWQTERVGELELTTAFGRTMDELAISYRVRRDDVAALRAAGRWHHDA